MVGRLVMVATLAGGLLVTGVAWGQSKCDKGINKASAKKVGCICKAISKGSTLGDAITACSTKFGTSCTKAKGKNDCVVQTGSCSNKETECDNAAASICAGSPSGAFLDADLSRF